MKLTMVISRFYPNWGGSENQTKIQAAELARRGHQVTVVTWQHRPELPRVEVVDGATVRRVPLRPGKVGAVTSAARLCVEIGRRALADDAILANGIYIPAFLAALAAWMTRTPMAAMIAVSLDMPGVELNVEIENRISRAIRRGAIRFLAKHVIAIAMTDSIADGVRQLGFRRIVRIHNGVQDPGHPDRSEGRRELSRSHDVSQGGPLVVAAGRLVPQKGFDRLLRAWPEIVRNDGVARLLIVGSGSEEQALLELVQSLRIGDSVRIMSANPEVAKKIIRSADVFIISSRYEGLANVLLEAMVAGVPVVTTPVSGSVDLIRDGVDGRIVPHDDNIAMASAIRDVLGESEKMGNRARDRALSLCRLELVVDQLEALFSAAGGLPDGLYWGRELTRPRPAASPAVAR